MFYLNLLAYVILGDKINNIPFYPVSPKSRSHVLVHLGTCRVYDELGTVSLCHDVSFQIIITGNTQFVFKPKQTISKNLKF